MNMKNIYISSDVNALEVVVVFFFYFYKEIGVLPSSI